MAIVDISTTQNVGIQLESASVLHRAGAWLIDTVFLFIGAIVLSLVLDQIGSIPNAAWQSATASIYVVYYCCWILYPLALESLLNGQTLGKKILRIRVVCLDGSRPTFGAYCIRWVLGLVELTFLIGSLAFTVVLFSRRSQRLGDIVAGTTVVMVKPVVTLSDLLLNVADPSVPIPFPEARYLTDDDVQVLRDVLKAQSLTAPDAVRTKVLYMAVEGLEKRLGVMRTTTPEQFVMDVITSYGRIHQ